MSAALLLTLVAPFERVGDFGSANASAPSSGDDPFVSSSVEIESANVANSERQEGASDESSASESALVEEEICDSNATNAERVGPFGRFFSSVLPPRLTEAFDLDFDEFPLATASSVDYREAVVCSHWAKFPVGAWARRRTTSNESYDDGRSLQSVTETRALLKKVDFTTGRYTLEFEQTIKMGGVDYSRKSETHEFDFWDVPTDGDVQVENLGPINLKIGFKIVPCQTRRVTRDTPKYRETTTIWYSTVVEPFIIRRETVREPKGDEKASTSRKLYAVRDVAPRFRLNLAPINFVAYSSSEIGARRASTTTVFSETTPGGVLRETTQETSANGDSYQTDSSLLDYYVPR